MGTLSKAIFGALTLYSSLMVAASLPCRPRVDTAKELLITDLRVVNDLSTRGAGPLSFYSLFKKLTGLQTDSDLQLALQSWFDQWTRSSLGDGTPSVPRSTQILEWNWPKNVEGQPSLVQAPFVLSAIVYRPDVLQADGMAIEGELRFVYNLIHPQDGSPLQFTTIFEFPIFANGIDNPVQEFHKLGQLPFGPNYQAQLINLLDRSSSIGARLRTDDFLLAFLWDLREFRMSNKGEVLLQPLPMTPALEWSAEPARHALENWVRGNQLAIAQDSWTLDSQFRTANAFVPNEGFTWLSNTGIDEPTRHQFALHTCNGCHGGETTTRFTHIEPRNRLGTARVSEFVKNDLIARQHILEARLCHKGKALESLIKRSSIPH